MCISRIGKNHMRIYITMILTDIGIIMYLFRKELLDIFIITYHGKSTLISKLADCDCRTCRRTANCSLIIEVLRKIEAYFRFFRDKLRSHTCLHMSKTCKKKLSFRINIQLICSQFFFFDIIISNQFLYFLLIPFQFKINTGMKS